jgi:perosamine synthetase
MNPTEVEKKITKKTKAIIAVHIYGLPADLKPLQRLAKKNSLWLIEDAAEAQGAEYYGKRVGSIGDVAAFSMYANKTTSAGEGGIVTTNNSEIAKRIDLLRRHAFSHERHFWHTMTGFGYRMTNLQAAVGYGQVERFRELTEKKLINAKWYTEYLTDVSGLTLPFTPKACTNVHWMYGIIVDQKKFGITKNQLRYELAKNGIETRSFFIPMHWQPVLYKRFRNEHYPVSEVLCRDGLYLPSSTKLTKRDIRSVCDKIIAASSHSHKR